MALAAALSTVVRLFQFKRMIETRPWARSSCPTFGTSCSTSYSPCSSWPTILSDAHDASRLSLRRLSHVLVARAERRAVRRLLATVRSDLVRVADVPCGTGKLLPVFRDLGVAVVGGDVSAEMMQIARADNRTEGQHSEF